MAARSYFGKSVTALGAGGGRAARRPRQGTELLQPRPLSRAGARALRLCARQRCARTARIDAGEVKPRRSARCRRSSPSSARGRTSASTSSTTSGASEDDRGHRRADARSYIGPLDDQLRRCSAPPRRRCRKGWRATRLNTGRRSSRCRDQSRRGIRRIEAAPRTERQARVAAALRMRGCRSTTCIGRPRSSSNGRRTRMRTRSSARRLRRRTDAAAHDVADARDARACKLYDVVMSA